jgi:hypothetical protein
MYIFQKDFQRFRCQTKNPGPNQNVSDPEHWTERTSYVQVYRAGVGIGLTQKCRCKCTLYSDVQQGVPRRCRCTSHLNE